MVIKWAAEENKILRISSAIFGLFCLASEFMKTVRCIISYIKLVYWARDYGTHLWKTFNPKLKIFLNFLLLLEGYLAKVIKMNFCQANIVVSNLLNHYYYLKDVFEKLLERIFFSTFRMVFRVKIRFKKSNNRSKITFSLNIFIFVIFTKKLHKQISKIFNKIYETRVYRRVHFTTCTKRNCSH